MQDAERSNLIKGSLNHFDLAENSMGITAKLAAFSASIDTRELPPAVVERARHLVLDLVGNIVRGRSAESTPALLSTLRALGFERGDCRVPGDPEPYSYAGAALAGGVFAHSLDFDDTHAASTLHPGAPVISAALAAAQMVDASGAELLAAIVAGYEVICRVGLALPAGDHYQRGFHPTATCGAFGAAAAAARVFGLSAAAIDSALGIALSQSAGSLQFLANGAWTKRFQVGWASMSGLVAATLARDGYKGPIEALEGKHGFLNAYAPAPQPERVTQDLGDVFELMATGVKPYPSCRYGHAGIDAALALRAEHDLRADEIDRVIYGISHAGLLLVGLPAAKKSDPQNIVDAQFSAPFVLASALATGRMQWDSYAQLHDPVIRRLLPKIRCEHSAAIEAEFPANMSGTLTVHARGTTFSKTVIVPGGEPDKFLGEAQLLAKFTDLAAPVLGDARTTALASALLQLDRLPNLASVFASALPTAG
jgi:2-methylcitrate dehydratase PrpD